MSSETVIQGLRDVAALAAPVIVFLLAFILHRREAELQRTKTELVSQRDQAELEPLKTEIASLEAEVVTDDQDRLKKLARLHDVLSPPPSGPSEK